MIETECDALDDAIYAPAHDASPNAAEAPIDEVPTTELLEAMEAALLTLPRFTREVFLAHRLDDLSYAEMARITGTSVRRIEREIARALAGIDRALCDGPLAQR